MQLDLGTDPRTEILRRMHDRLIDEFGRVIRPDDERRDPIWTLVQGVIGARAKTAVSNANTDRLIAAYGTWDKVAEEELSALTAALKTATFPAMAAERLKACLQNIIDQRGRATLDHLAELDTAEAMEWLEQLPGVARKISAGVMNTSHFNRMALMLVLPPEWSAEDIDEHHMLGKRLAQTICRPKQPHCEVCPVRSDCDHGR